jgi:integrase
VGAPPAPVRPPRPRRAPKLFKKANGFHYALFYDGRRQPARKWIALLTTSQRQARRVFAPMEDAWLTGKWDPWRDPWGTSTTVAEAAERYLASRGRKWRESTTAPWNVKFFGRFVAALPPGLLVEHVRPADVDAFTNAPTSAAMGANGGRARSPETVRTYRAALLAFFAWCIEAGLCETNPAAATERPGKVRRPPEHLTPDQFRRLLAEIRSDAALKRALGRAGRPGGRAVVWLADAVELAVYTGLREGELVRLRWRDVELAGGADGRTASVRVRHTARGKAKTEGSVGDVPLVSPAVALLRRLHDERADEDPDGPVLASPAPGPDGRPRPMSVTTLQKRFKHYAARVGVDADVHVHSLRKTTATWLASQGVPMQVIQRVLRHSNVQVTSGAYAGVWDDSVRREVERAFAGLLGPAPE